MSPVVRIFVAEVPLSVLRLKVPTPEIVCDSSLGLDAVNAKQLNHPLDHGPKELVDIWTPGARQSRH